MFSMKTKYAVCACLNLARRTDRPSMIISEISQAGNLPQKFLESILQDLRRGGLLHSRKGRNGGYSLARPPYDISLGEIIRLTGSLRLDAEASRQTPDHTSDSAGVDECNISELLEQVRQSLLRVLEETSLQDILDRWESTHRPSSVDWII